MTRHPGEQQQGHAIDVHTICMGIKLAHHWIMVVKVQTMEVVISDDLLLIGADGVGNHLVQLVDGDRIYLRAENGDGMTHQSSLSRAPIFRPGLV